jgi:hypothetical protein
MKMQPQREMSDKDADKYADEMLATFKQLHGCTVLEAFTAKNAGVITEDDFEAAFETARLAIETEGTA